MILAALLSFFLFFGLFIVSWFFGGYVLEVMEKDRSCRLMRPFGWLLEGGVRRLTRIEMTYKEYLMAVLSFSFISCLVIYCCLRFQPAGVPSHIAWNMAISFTTNTDWQTSFDVHPLLKWGALVPEMFLSPAVGLSCFFVLLRGLAGERLSAGNFFRDMGRALVYVLIPLSIVVALLLRLLGVEQGFFFHGKEPIAFFEAIRQLGTNGASYVISGVAQKPSILVTIVEWACMLFLPMSALRIISQKLGVKLFGMRVGVMFCVILSVLVGIVQYSESSVDHTKEMVAGKELPVDSFLTSLWSVSMTATSSGSSITPVESLQPASQIVLLALMHTGESIFGGVGVGAISLLFMQIFAMFSAGLLVGRTPDLFGKKIDSGTMKLVLLGVLLPVFLIYSGLWIQIGFGKSSLPQDPERAITPLIYMLTSTSVNNGSQMGGLEYTSVFISILCSVLMLLGRLLLLIFAIILAEHMSYQKIHPRTEGSIRIESWTSVVWLGFIILSSSVLCFCSLWLLGPGIQGSHL